MSKIESFAKSEDGYIVAPAGCGKTEFIIRSLKLCQDKQLVLTHTNAGVRSLRKRAIKRQLESKNYTIKTIAGFCLTLCNAFPTIANISFKDRPDSNQEWNQAYVGALNILKQPIGKKITINSYNGLFVDEYQDCLKKQHEIIQTIGRYIPVRVAGDPLQGIFDFANNVTIDWETDVQKNYTKIAELTKPWRWLQEDTDEELGRWILTAREKILNNETIELTDLPSSVRCIQPKMSGFYSEALSAAGNESTIFIVKWPAQAISRAKSYGGRFNSMEEKELNDLKAICSLIDSKESFDLCDVIFDISKKCISKIGSEYKTIIRRIDNQRKDLAHGLSKNRELANSLTELLNEKSYVIIESLFQEIGNNQNCNIYRKELFRFLLKTLEEYNSGDSEDLSEAIKEVRNRLRYYGRRIYNRTITRVLLIKGLEFDHTLIDLAQDYTINELYVAISRPQKSLTLITSNDKIEF